MYLNSQARMSKSISRIPYSRIPNTFYQVQNNKIKSRCIFILVFNESISVLKNTTMCLASLILAHEIFFISFTKRAKQKMLIGTLQSPNG